MRTQRIKMCFRTLASPHIFFTGIFSSIVHVNPHQIICFSSVLVSSPALCFMKISDNHKFYFVQKLLYFESLYFTLQPWWPHPYCSTGLQIILKTAHLVVFAVSTLTSFICIFTVCWSFSIPSFGFLYDILYYDSFHICHLFVKPFFSQNITRKRTFWTYISCP